MWLGSQASHIKHTVERTELITHQHEFRYSHWFHENEQRQSQREEI
jgi:hypothetical protein